MKIFLFWINCTIKGIRTIIWNNAQNIFIFIIPISVEPETIIYQSDCFLQSFRHWNFLCFILSLKPSHFSLSIFVQVERTLRKDWNMQKILCIDWYRHKHLNNSIFIHVFIFILRNVATNLKYFIVFFIEDDRYFDYCSLLFIWRVACGSIT